MHSFKHFTWIFSFIPHLDVEEGISISNSTKGWSKDSAKAPDNIGQWCLLSDDGLADCSLGRQPPMDARNPGGCAWRLSMQGR